MGHLVNSRTGGRVHLPSLNWGRTWVRTQHPGRRWDLVKQFYLLMSTGGLNKTESGVLDLILGDCTQDDF
jgi:hypothetical protein